MLGTTGFVLFIKAAHHRLDALLFLFLARRVASDWRSFSHGSDSAQYAAQVLYSGLARY